MRIYTFNVVGYRAGQLLSGQRGCCAFGGLTDATSSLPPVLEDAAGRGLALLKERPGLSPAAVGRRLDAKG